MSILRPVAVSLLCGLCLACTSPNPLVGEDAGPPTTDGGTPPIVVAMPDVEQVATPPISGGNLLVTASGWIVASDPDRATLWVLDPSVPRVVGHLSLEADALPGQLAEDGTGSVHVVLRRAGELLSLDPRDLRVLERRAVCPAPRGLAWDRDEDLLWVACAGGELVALAPRGGDVVRAWSLDDDLRDVVATDGTLYVSRFRSAEVLTVDRTTGDVLARRVPGERRFDIRGREAEEPTFTVPNTAWRLRAGVDGGVLMLHQRSIRTDVRNGNNAYGGTVCSSGVVAPSLSFFPPGDARVEDTGNVMHSPLAIDFVEAATGEVTLARAATDAFGPGAPTGVMQLSADWRYRDCLGEERAVLDRRGTSTGVDRLSDGQLVVLYRDPLRVVVGTSVVFEGTGLVRDRGFELFHSNTPSMTACASCHPEGGEDGHVWLFEELGARRTQTLLGGILETVPFHWNGDQADMSAIMTGGFVARMGGRVADPIEDIAAIERWIDAQPLPARSIVDSDAVARGLAVFADPAAGCADCHAGPALTNGATVDVGSGGAFQVPALRGVGQRAPYFHDGCAATLRELVDGVCHAEHTQTEHLDVGQRADLVAYLGSL